MRDEGGERAGRNSWVQATAATPALPAFRTDDRNVELSLEREPKTDERRTANDGPLSILFLSRIVPGGGGGGCAKGGEGGSLRSRGVRSEDRGFFSTPRLRSS